MEEAPARRTTLRLEREAKALREQLARSEAASTTPT